MRSALRIIGSLTALMPLLGMGAAVLAAPPSETILPDSVVGYVSVASAPEFDKRWGQTQLGQMFDDEVMQPFVEDLREQLDSKFEGLDSKLGFTYDELEGVASGEMSLSILEREGRDAAIAITMDVAGHAEQATAFLEAVEKRFAARGGRKQEINRSGTTLHVFEVPARERGQKDQTTVYFIKDDLLVGIDDRQESEAILDRFSAAPKGNLQNVESFQATMKRCTNAAGDLVPEARWYAEPFALIFAIRTLRDEPAPAPRDDYARMFAENGFDAIQGVGGFVNLLVDGGIEILHRTSIYAPPTKANDPLRWNLSMRMLQLPNSDSFEPQSWVPRMSASYTTANIDLMAAFDNIGPVFDALQGHKNAWANTLEGWELDPYGAQINVRKEFVANLGQRITIVTDYEIPISPTSERSLTAIEATNEQALSAALAKWMSKESVEERQINGIQVWERVTEEPEIEPLAIPGLSPIGGDPPPAAEEDEEGFERVLPNSASCVAMGHLLVASDIEYLREILEGFGQHERLSASPDYLHVAALMEKVAPGERSGWIFARTDEDIRPVYELVRRNEMPQSETMLGRLLNDLLSTDLEKQEGILRKQRIDGSKLPNFEAVRRYFGPAGRVLQSQEDGWLLTGSLLNKSSQ